MPRGHLKSTVCSVGLALWRIWLNPNVRILVGTASKDLALSFVREVKQYLEDPELQNRVWNNRPHIPGPLIPQLEGNSGQRKSKRKRNAGDDDNFDEGYTEALDKKVLWKQDAIQVLRPSIMKEPTLVATSVNSPDTGFHYDVFIADDCVTFKNSGTEPKRQTILNWIADQESVVDPFNPKTGLGGEFIMLGTRYYHRDAYGIYSNADLTAEELEELKEDVGEAWGMDEFALFSRNIYANGVDDTDGYLWPERFNARVLASIRRRMCKQPGGERRFASQYLNRVHSASDAELSWESIITLSAHEVDPRPDLGIVRVTLGGQVVEVRPVIAIDPAISQSTRADYTAIAVVGLTSAHQVIALDLVADRLTPSETVEQTYELMSKYGLRVLWVDNEKLGQALSYTFRASFDKHYAIVIKEHSCKGDKLVRLQNRFEPVINGGLMYATRAVMANKPFQQNVQFFGSSGVHDDPLDAIDIALEHATPSTPPAPTPSDASPGGRYARLTLEGMRRRSQSPRQHINSRYGGYYQ
jgi:predicted phage terminase large subunit-like protein